MVNSITENVNHRPVPEDIMVELHLLKNHTMSVNNQCRLRIYRSRQLTCRKKILKYYSMFAMPPNIFQLSTMLHASQDSDQIKLMDTAMT